MVDGVVVLCKENPEKLDSDEETVLVLCLVLEECLEGRDANYQETKVHTRYTACRAYSRSTTSR